MSNVTASCHITNGTRWWYVAADLVTSAVWKKSVKKRACVKIKKKYISVGTPYRSRLLNVNDARKTKVRFPWLLATTSCRSFFFCNKMYLLISYSIYWGVLCAWLMSLLQWPHICHMTHVNLEWYVRCWCSNLGNSGGVYKRKALMFKCYKRHWSVCVSHTAILLDFIIQKKQKPKNDHLGPPNIILGA